MTDKIKPTDITVFMLGGWQVEYQVSDTKDHYRHRLVIPGVAEDTNWHSYDQIAYVHVKQQIFCAATDRWRSLFPQTFEIIRGGLVRQEMISGKKVETKKKEEA